MRNLGKKALRHQYCEFERKMVGGCLTLRKIISPRLAIFCQAIRAV